GQVNSGTVFRFSTNGTLTRLTSFGGTNGANPQCQLVMDAAGNFYGTTPVAAPNSFGTIFRVATNGVVSTLVAFNQTNGASPQCDALAVGNDGNFYGTTVGGGTNGLGSVFRVPPGGTLTSLFSFNNANGSQPQGGLIQVKDGNFYGTTTFGGSGDFGTIFKIITNGVLTTLFNFHFTDGSLPLTKLIQGNDGALYGTTLFGGDTNGIFGSAGQGTLFRITTNGVFTSLVLFQGTNGSNPFGSLIVGPDGNLYGTTTHSGLGGGGTIFRVVLSAQPQLAGVIKLANGSSVVTGTGPAASGFRLWATTNVSRPFSTWTLLTNSVFASDGTFSFTDNAAANMPARFYRVSVP